MELKKQFALRCPRCSAELTTVLLRRYEPREYMVELETREIIEELDDDQSWRVRADGHFVCPECKNSIGHALSFGPWEVWRQGK